MKSSRIGNDNTANQERHSHGLPYFFVYIPFGSPDGENIILSFAVSTIVFRIKNHIQTENEPRNSANAETDSDFPEILPPSTRSRNQMISQTVSGQEKSGVFHTKIAVIC